MVFAALETNNTIGKHVEAHLSTRDSGFLEILIDLGWASYRDAQ